MICLDTDFILDFLNERQEALDKLKSSGEEDLFSTEISYFEVLFGVFKKQEISSKELESANGFFDSINLLPLNHKSAYHAALISGDLTKQGLVIGFNDCLIAGICLNNNCTILTRNTKHFSRIAGLKVETY